MGPLDPPLHVASYFFCTIMVRGGVKQTDCFDFLSYSLSSHIPDSDMAELYVVGDKLETRKKGPKKRINSNLLAVEFIDSSSGRQLKGPLTHPAVITLKHLHVSNIKCRLAT